MARFSSLYLWYQKILFVLSHLFSAIFVVVVVVVDDVVDVVVVDDDVVVVVVEMHA